MSSKTSSVSGPIRLDLTPYIRGPLEAFSDPKVRRLFLCFGTQSGKTTFLQCVLGFIIDQAPGPTMFLRPTEGDAASFSKERMIPLISDTDSLKKHVIGSVVGADAASLIYIPWLVHVVPVPLRQIHIL